MAFIPFQTDCNEDMAGIMDKLRSLKHNISGVAEPTQQIFNKFVIEESLKWAKKIFLENYALIEFYFIPFIVRNGNRRFVIKGVHVKPIQLRGQNT